MLNNLKIKRRRIYYLPGLLSLVILPIAIYLYVNKKHLLQKKVVIEIISYDSKNVELYPELYPQIFPPKRKYSEIYLSGDDQNDRIKLDFAQLAIRDLIAASDTTRGIILNFTDKTKYWTLVRAIDICNIEKCKTFAFSNNKVFVFNLPPVAIEPSIINKKQFNCDTSLVNCLPEIIPDTSPSFSTRIKLLVKQLKIYYLSGVLFLLMVVLTIRKILKSKDKSSFLSKK